MTYEYKCPKCELVTEIRKPVAEMERVEKCETCSTELKRLISKTSFQLKGGGWASTGYDKAKVEFKMRDGSREVVDYDTKKLKDKG